MKKIIDIPDEMVHELRIIAIKEKMNLKNFIESKLIQIVKNNKLKQND
jgi:hypothetical protein